MKKDLRDIINNHIILHAESEDIYVIAVDSAISSNLYKLKNQLGHRFIDVGVAEQNAFGVAAGLAQEGATVFVFGISTFLLYRGYEQLRSIICENKLKVIFVGLWCGLYYSDQGYTHLQIDDINATRSLPNLNIYSPYSVHSTTRCLVDSLEHHGPSYFRIENPLPGSDYLDTHVAWNSSTRNDSTELAILATGQSVKRSLLASKHLNSSLKLQINVHPLCDLDVKRLQPSIQEYVNHYQNLLIVEEHLAYCGLGASIGFSSSVKHTGSRIHCLGVGGEVVRNQTYDRALEFHTLNTPGIINRCLSILEG
ncbi:putative 33.6 kDa protein in fasciation locus precursor [compost metagenome]